MRIWYVLRQLRPLTLNAKLLVFNAGDSEPEEWTNYGVVEYWRNRNLKSQISNSKQTTMTNPPPADQTCFGHLVLEFEICL